MPEHRRRIDAKENECGTSESGRKEDAYASSHLCSKEEKALPSARGVGDKRRAAGSSISRKNEGSGRRLGFGGGVLLEIGNAVGEGKTDHHRKPRARLISSEEMDI